MKSGVGLFLSGFCMGIADLFPGISGGTVAFLLGVYPLLLQGLNSFDRQFIRLFFARNWREIGKKGEWGIVVPLFSGMGIALLLFARLIHTLLLDPAYRLSLYAFFFGLVLASFSLCIRQVKQWTFLPLVELLGGAAVACFLSSARAHLGEGAISLIWVFVGGILAVGAFLLPGISGSYLLTLLGLYPPVIRALVESSDWMRGGACPVDSLVLLSTLLGGMIVGVSLFSPFLAFLWEHYPNDTFAFLSGLMIGGIGSVWPFWDIYWEEGERVVRPFLPSYHSLPFWEGVFFACMGAFLLSLSWKWNAGRCSRKGENCCVNEEF